MTMPDIDPAGVYEAHEQCYVGVALAADVGHRIPGDLVIKNGWQSNVHRIDQDDTPTNGDSDVDADEAADAPEDEVTDRDD